METKTHKAPWLLTLDYGFYTREARFKTHEEAKAYAEGIQSHFPDVGYAITFTESDRRR